MRGGIILLAILALTAAAAPWIAPHDPSRQIWRGISRRRRRSTRWDRTSSGATSSRG